MADHLKPQFFVTRHNGSMVPLIALDELPHTLVIRGVPRLLSADDLPGMTCVGTFQARHCLHQVDNLNNSPPTALSRKPLYTNDARRQPGTPVRNVLERTQAETEHSHNSSKTRTEGIGQSKFLSSHESPPNQESDLPVLGKKIYCSHWVKRGECDFAQQGCLYKHEMPMDIKTLQSIGFNDIPQWYRMKYGVPSLRAVKGSDAALGGDGMRHRRFVIATENSRAHANRSNAPSFPPRSKARRNRQASKRSAGTGQESLTSVPSSPFVLPTKLPGKSPSVKRVSQWAKRQRLHSTDTAKQHKTGSSGQQVHDIDRDLLQFNDGDQFVPLVPEKSLSLAEGSPVLSRREVALEEASVENSSESQRPRSDASGEVEEHRIREHRRPSRRIDADSQILRLQHSHNETSNANQSDTPMIDPALFSRSFARRHSNVSDTPDIETEIVMEDAARRAKEEESYAAQVAAAAISNAQSQN